MQEQEKYQLIWKRCGRYGKDWTDKGLGRPYKRPFLEKVPTGSTVIDFGCGNGTSLSWLRSEGMQPKGVEIAENAVTAKNPPPGINFLDLRDSEKMKNVGVCEYGICTDVMEHIPTVDVPKVIRNISNAVSKAVLFGIARLPDKDGEEFGLDLHLTLENAEWWNSKILGSFHKTETVRYDEGVYLFWAFNG
jgi:hypothetical protein